MFTPVKNSDYPMAFMCLLNVFYHLCFFIVYTIFFISCFTKSKVYS